MAASAVALFLATAPITAAADPTEFGVRVEKPVEPGKLYSQGSGVLIGKSLVLTAAHVVRYHPADPMVTVLVENRRVQGRLAFVDTEGHSDLALIQIKPQVLPPKSRGKGATLCTRDPGAGRPVIVVSSGETSTSQTVAAPDKAEKPEDWLSTLATNAAKPNE
jgi:hypothetical protein